MIVKILIYFPFVLVFPSKNKTWNISFNPHLTRSHQINISLEVCVAVEMKIKRKNSNIIFDSIVFCERGRENWVVAVNWGEEEKKKKKMIFLVTRKGKIGNCVFFCVKKALNIFSHPSLSRRFLLNILSSTTTLHVMF